MLISLPPAPLLSVGKFVIEKTRIAEFLSLSFFSFRAVVPGIISSASLGNHVDSVETRCKCYRVTGKKL